MALLAYRQELRKLLGDQQVVRFNEFDLVGWINSARGQIALESQSVRAWLGFTLPGASNTYNFSQFTIPGGKGFGTVAVVRQILGNGIMEGRPWPMFSELYWGVAAAGVPKIWSQYGLGASGSLAFYPTSATDTTMIADAVLTPIALATDAEVEAIPFPWTDAVPYFAAWRAYLSIQQMEAAGNMLTAYSAFMRRGSEITTPTILPENFEGRAGAAAASMSQTLAASPAPQNGRQQ